MRAEYAYLPDPVFRAGPLRLLESLLEHTDLFHTCFGRIHWEDRARDNMRAEMERLSGDARPER